jgi:hypothetical protein
MEDIMDWRIISGKNYSDCFKNLQITSSNDTNSPHPKVTVQGETYYRPLTVRENMGIIVESDKEQRDRLLETRIDSCSAIFRNETSGCGFISECFPLISAAIDNLVDEKSTYKASVDFPDDPTNRSKLRQTLTSLEITDFYATAFGYHPGPWPIVKEAKRGGGMYSALKLLMNQKEEVLINDPFWQLMVEQDLDLLKKYLQCIRSYADQDERGYFSGGVITPSGQTLRLIGGQINFGMCFGDVFFPVSFGSQDSRFEMGFIPPAPLRDIDNGVRLIQVINEN